jgi:hypothetical protein
MSDISETTGDQYYSGSWEDIRNICRVLNIGEGKISKITQSLVNYYQEMVDREIDADAEQYYYTPFRTYRQYMPSLDDTVDVFPGEIRSLARYWTAGLLLTSEFQGLDPNSNDSAQNYITESKQKLFNIIQYTRRIRGQKKKHNLRPMLPNMAPGRTPEANF